MDAAQVARLVYAALDAGEVPGLHQVDVLAVKDNIVRIEMPQGIFLVEVRRIGA